MKKTFVILLMLSAVILPSFAQIEYGYDRPKSSTDPWKFGINANVSMDWINQQKYIEKQIGWKAGISGEKHLVYNIYFRPVLNFVKRGFVCDKENDFKNEVNAYLMDLELTVEMKFGDERKGRGFLCYFAPFFTYGIGGTSTYTNLKSYESGYNTPQNYGTFDEYMIKKEDVGFILGAGYDINHHVELMLNYTVGFFNVGSYNNFRWRNVNFGLTYFF